jgi:hypothetical protein
MVGPKRCHVQAPLCKVLLKKEMISLLFKKKATKETLLDLVQTEANLALGHAMGRPNDSEANRTKSLALLLGVESKTSSDKMKKKKSSGNM